MDFYKFINVFPELILTANREKINWLVARPANWCRYGIQNKAGDIDKCYVSTEWGSTLVTDEKVLKRPVLNPVYDMPEELRDNKKGLNYMYPLSYPSGRTYYQLASWNAIRKSKWLELANKIPAFKLSVMKNQISIK